MCVSDRKVSFGSTFSADNLTVKDVPFSLDTWALVAGNDVEYSGPILKRAGDILFEQHSNNLKPGVSDAADAVDQALAEKLHTEISRRVLRKRGFDVNTFRDHGKQKCTPSAYLSLCARIDQIKLSLRFLVCGFDDEGEGHIYSVDGETASKCYDSIGMWAIGSGSPSALSCLAFHIDRSEMSKFMSPEEVTYFAITAKFMAEASGDVGKKSTFVTVEKKGEKTRYVRQDGVDAIRSIWEEEGCPRAPKDLSTQMAPLTYASDDQDNKV